MLVSVHIGKYIYFVILQKLWYKAKGKGWSTLTILTLVSHNRNLFIQYAQTLFPSTPLFIVSDSHLTGY